MTMNQRNRDRGRLRCIGCTGCAGAPENLALHKTETKREIILISPSFVKYDFSFSYQGRYEADQRKKV